MQTEKQQVYHCRGIVKQLNAYIKADKLLILCESDVPAEIKKDITAQFPEAACYTVPGTAHIKTFDNLEAIVRFLSKRMSKGKQPADYRESATKRAGRLYSIRLLLRYSLSVCTPHRKRRTACCIPFLRCGFNGDSGCIAKLP